MDEGIWRSCNYRVGERVFSFQVRGLRRRWALVVDAIFEGRPKVAQGWPVFEEAVLVQFGRTIQDGGLQENEESCCGL